MSNEKLEFIIDPKKDKIENIDKLVQKFLHKEDKELYFQFNKELDKINSSDRNELLGLIQKYVTLKKG